MFYVVMKIPKGVTSIDERVNKIIEEARLTNLSFLGFFPKTNALDSLMIFAKNEIKPSLL